MDSRFTLEKRIQAELASYDGKMCLYADDFHGNIICLGADERVETASTVKVYILASLFWQVELGRASLEDMIPYEEKHVVDGSGVLCALEPGASFRVKDAATLMIIVSDNIATNMIIDYLGIDTINACIRELGCNDTVLYKSLHFDRFDRLGTTTARDMITREFPPVYMDSDNTDQVLIHVASKSGSMDACRNDGGIIYTPYGPYVLVMLNKDFSDAMYYPDHPATVFGAKVSRMLLDQFLALEGRLL